MIDDRIFFVYMLWEYLALTLTRAHAGGGAPKFGVGSHPFSWPNLKTRLRVPIAQLPYMPFLVAAGDQSTVTNVQAACDIDGAMCCLAPLSF